MVITLVGMQLGRASPWTAGALLDRRYGIDHLLQQLAVVAVGRRNPHGQGDAVGIDEDVASGALLAAVGRVRPSLLAPFCRDGGAVHGGSFPVDRVGVAEPIQEDTVQAHPDASLMPFVQAAPARHAGAAAHLHRQQFPRDAALQHEQDAGQCRVVIQPWPPALRFGRFRRDQRLNNGSQGVGYKGSSHAPSNSPNRVSLGALTTQGWCGK